MVLVIALVFIIIGGVVLTAFAIATRTTASLVTAADDLLERRLARSEKLDRALSSLQGELELLRRGESTHDH